MPASSTPAALWALASRTLRPSYGARADAAEALRATRRARSEMTAPGAPPAAAAAGGRAEVGR